MSFGVLVIALGYIVFMVVILRGTVPAIRNSKHLRWKIAVAIALATACGVVTMVAGGFLALGIGGSDGGGMVYLPFAMLLTVMVFFLVLGLCLVRGVPRRKK